VTDVALGVLPSRQSRTPVYPSGYDPGYEEVAFPGRHDPATADDVPPLMNAFETAALVDSPCPMVDAFKLEMRQDTVSPKLLAALDCVCERTQHAGEIWAALDELSWSLLGAATRTAIDRSARLICRHQETMTPEHRRVAEAIRSHASPVTAAATATAAYARLGGGGRRRRNGTSGRPGGGRGGRPATGAFYLSETTAPREASVIQLPPTKSVPLAALASGSGRSAGPAALTLPTSSLAPDSGEAAPLADWPS
jgi:hypothetical protein